MNEYQVKVPRIVFEYWWSQIVIQENKSILNPFFIKYLCEKIKLKLANILNFINFLKKKIFINHPYLLHVRLFVNDFSYPHYTWTWMSRKLIKLRFIYAQCLSTAVIVVVASHKLLHIINHQIWQCTLCIGTTLIHARVSNYYKVSVYVLFNHTFDAPLSCAVIIVFQY